MGTRLQSDGSEFGCKVKVRVRKATGLPLKWKMWLSGFVGICKIRESEDQELRRRDAELKSDDGRPPKQATLT